MILANVASVFICLGQLLTKFLKRVGYENFLYKGCTEEKGGVQTPLHTVPYVLICGYPLTTGLLNQHQGLEALLIINIMIHAAFHQITLCSILRLQNT